MQVLVFCTLGSIAAAAAQSPQVYLVNLSHPFSSEFQTGDRFEVRISGAPDQPISVRTTRQGRTDWGPVIASTDSTGRWSAAGQFEKSDFGGWSEVWTVGGKLATPAIQFFVKAPCLPGGHSHAFVSGPNEILTCDTAEQGETFVTPSLSDPFRTPDGRMVPGRPIERTPEQYHMEILSDSITTTDPGVTHIFLSSDRGGLGDEVAGLIEKLIGPNALNESETRNVLAVVRAAFERPEAVAPDSREPARTLVFLRHLSERTDVGNVRERIAATIAELQGR